ncbi:hypothetical protein BLA28_20180 [Eisenbergiella tayi]|uniref:hypothetical protein n=1 Tax=Eisenbergiella tayi TaxID=1432052 RepID=UPI0008FD0E28|nr:hypothetical protein [Eisenbergiella tayi]OIZ62715.1 hypothetical protein BLA28_20180 [Eisenbergiella tayi]
MSIEQQINGLGKQIADLQKVVANLNKLIMAISKNSQKVMEIEKPVIVPVKNVTQEQLYFAFTRQKLSLPQLMELSGHKFSEEQIKNKLIKEHTKYEHI